jgi:hypothetical protein
MPDAGLECVGVLLRRCPLPATPCGSCWFATDHGERTLVRIESFFNVKANRAVREIRSELHLASPGV